MSMVIINPGTGPVDGREDLANAGAEAFKADLDLPGIVVTPKGSDGEGRWDYEFALGSARCEVSIPGVRVDVLKGDLLQAPRLYVDGSSWWWKYALSQARAVLTGSDYE